MEQTSSRSRFANILDKSFVHWVYSILISLQKVLNQILTILPVSDVISGEAMNYAIVICSPRSAQIAALSFLIGRYTLSLNDVDCGSFCSAIKFIKKNNILTFSDKITIIRNILISMLVTHSFVTIFRIKMGLF